MNILETLGDISLRRLYKFIIKGVIGRYLENELLIDQLNVQSKTGLVILSDLALNCDVLNEEFINESKSPLRITKATVNSLEAKLSYTLLLAESCQVLVKGLEIVIEPHVWTTTKNSNPLEAKEIDSPQNIEQYENNYASDDNNGLDLVARWIDVIIASLRFHVENATFIFLDRKSNSEIRITIDKISYYNTHPDSIKYSTDTSVSLSSKSVRFTSDKSSVISLGNKKLFQIEGLTVTVHPMSSEHKILSVLGAIKIQLKNLKKHNIPYSEHDIQISPMVINFTMDSCDIFLRVVNAFLQISPKKSSSNNDISSFQKPSKAVEALMRIDPSLGVILWLEEQNKKSSINDDGIDYSKLLSILKKQQAQKSKEDTIDWSLNDRSQYRSMSASAILATSSAVIDDDDEDFPASDEENELGDTLGESAFFDAGEGSPSQKLRFAESMRGSQLLQSTRRIDFGSMQSERIINGDLIPSKENMIQINFDRLDIRFHENSQKVCSESASISSSNCLCVTAKDISISYSTRSFVSSDPDSNLEDSHSSMSFKTNSLRVFEASLSEIQDLQYTNEVSLLSFYHDNSTKQVTIPEDIDIEVCFGQPKYNTTISEARLHKETKVSVKLEPILASIKISRALKWAKLIQDMFKTIQINADADAPFETSLQLDIEELNLLILPEDSPTSLNIPSWDDFLASLDIQNFPERWDILKTVLVSSGYEKTFPQQLAAHLNQSRSLGGVKMKAKDLGFSFCATRQSPVKQKESPKNQNADKQGVSISQLEISMFLKIPNENVFRESVVLTAFKNLDNEESKIFIRHQPNLSSRKANVSSFDLIAQNNGSQEGRALYGDDESILEPDISGSALLHMYAYRIAIDVRQRELNAIISLSKYFTFSSDEQDKRSSTEGNQNFGVLFHSEVATIRVSENLKSFNENNIALDPLNDESFCICLSASDPLIKVLSTAQPQQLFFSIQAQDMSMFEMTNRQFETSFSRTDFSCKRTNHFSRKPRFGTESHFVPFLHRTTLHSKSGTWSLQDRKEAKDDLSLKDTSNDNLDHTFRLQMLMSEESSLISEDLIKKISIHMSFQDVTMRYDPSSAWFIRVVDLMTPLSPQQVINKRNSISSHSGVVSQDNLKKPSLFEITKATARVRKCLIDYCCEKVPSRLLFSVGLLSLSTTVVSNSPTFSIKFSVRDISLHISNRLQHNGELEQSPLDPDGYRSELVQRVFEKNEPFGFQYSWIDYDTFLDEHLFVQLLTLDYQEALVTFHDDSAVMNQVKGISSAMSFKINIGLCCLYACIDSITVLSDTLLCWWTDFQMMIASSNKPTNTKESNRFDEATSIYDSSALSSELPFEIPFGKNESNMIPSGISNRSKEALAFLSDLGEDENYSQGFRPDPSLHSAINQNKPVHVDKLLKTSILKPVSADQNTNILKSKIPPTASKPGVSWMDQVQKEAFVPQIISKDLNATRNHYNSYQSGQGDNRKLSSSEENSNSNNPMGDFMINSGYYGRNFDNPPAPDYETRWIANYGENENTRSAVTNQRDDSESVISYEEASSSDDGNSVDGEISLLSSKASPIKGSKTTRNSEYTAIESSELKLNSIAHRSNKNSVTHDIDSQGNVEDVYESMKYNEIKGEVMSEGSDLYEFEDDIGDEELVQIVDLDNTSEINLSLLQRSVRSASTSQRKDVQNTSIMLDETLNLNESVRSKGLLYKNPNFFSDGLDIDDTNIALDELDDIIDEELAEDEYELSDKANDQLNLSKYKQQTETSNSLLPVFWKSEEILPKPEEYELDDFSGKSKKTILGGISIDESVDLLGLDDFQIKQDSRLDQDIDFDRFTAVDGVHNALQISIGNSVSFRKAGTNVLCREPSFNDERLDEDIEVDLTTGMERFENNSIVHNEISNNNDIVSVENDDIALDDDLNAIDQQPSLYSSNRTHVIQSQYYNQPIKEFEPLYQINIGSSEDRDIAFAWKEPYLPANDPNDYRTGWYDDPKRIKIDWAHNPIPTSSQQEFKLPEIERKLPVSTLLNVKASIRLRLFDGADWSDSPAPVQQFVPTSTKKQQDLNESMMKPSVKKATKSSTMKSSKDHTIENKLLAGLLDSDKGKSEGAKKSAVHRELFDKEQLSRGKSVESKKRKPFTLKTREKGDILDIFATNISIGLRVYDIIKYFEQNQNTNVDNESDPALTPSISQSTGKTSAIVVPPCQRLAFRVGDVLVSHQRVGHRKKKVMGWWRSENKPRAPGEPLLLANLVGYTTKDPAEILASRKNKEISPNNVSDDNLEHRVVVVLLPFRLYLDPYLIDFLKDLGDRQAAMDKSRALTTKVSLEPHSDSTHSKKAVNIMYFQMINIRAFDIKIDYNPAGIDLNALYNGDYLQLLNLFPLEGLTVTLKRVRLTGVAGLPSLLNQLVFAWVEDIYQNQLHRVISGTSPFRGIANIGSTLQELVLIPMNSGNSQSSSKKLVRDLTRKTSGLIQTVARETLHVTQKLTMFVARGITELASDDPVPVDPRRIKNASSRKRQEDNSSNTSAQPTSRAIRQPKGVNEGLARAYDSLKREMSSAVDSVIAVPIREYRRTGSSRVYVKSVVRALPVAVLRPLAGAAEGLSYTLLGLRNLIDPNSKVDEEDIWEVEKQAYPEA